MRVWFAPEDVKGGEKLHEQIDQAIRRYDKLLLVLSEASMASEWVDFSIEAGDLPHFSERRLVCPLVVFGGLSLWLRLFAGRLCRRQGAEGLTSALPSLAPPLTLATGLRQAPQLP